MNEPLPALEASAWRNTLTPLTDLPQSIVEQIVVLEETTSTQDECRRRAEGRPGLLVTTLRQTSGRGRLGRQWADDQGEGVALTISVPAQPPERLSIAAAIAVCEAAEQFAGRQLGIRWPNDIMADGRKLAGILIEQIGRIALIGIGINLNQTEWPTELSPIAISLRQLAADVPSRCQIIAHVLGRLAANLQATPEQLATAFQRRDILAGNTQSFQTGAERITGLVERIDPLQGLLVRTASGQRVLPASTTSLVH